MQPELRPPGKMKGSIVTINLCIVTLQIFLYLPISCAVMAPCPSFFIYFTFDMLFTVHFRLLKVLKSNHVYYCLANFRVKQLYPKIYQPIYQRLRNHSVTSLFIKLNVKHRLQSILSRWMSLYRVKPSERIR